MKDNILLFIVRILRYFKERLDEEDYVYEVLHKRAREESADYIAQNAKDAVIYKKGAYIWDYTCELLNDSNSDKSSKSVGFEFGVFKGNTINKFANSCPQMKFYGFDSFLGLKEDWRGAHHGKKAFNLNGKLPKVSNNVVLIKGWFDETLPKFLEEFDKSDEVCKLIHIDCDTYESTSEVLKILRHHIKPGLLILFDELFCYPNWQEGEFRALKEELYNKKINYKFLAIAQKKCLIKVI